MPAHIPTPSSPESSPVTTVAGIAIGLLSGFKVEVGWVDNGRGENPRLDIGSCSSDISSWLYADERPDIVDPYPDDADERPDIVDPYPDAADERPDFADPYPVVADLKLVDLYPDNADERSDFVDPYPVDADLKLVDLYPDNADERSDFVDPYPVDADLLPYLDDVDDKCE